MPIKDRAAIARAVAVLLDNDEKREKLAAAGRERIESLFCWSRAATQMVDYYMQLPEGSSTNANG